VVQKGPLLSWSHTALTPGLPACLHTLTFTPLTENHTEYRMIEMVPMFASPSTPTQVEFCVPRVQVFPCLLVNHTHGAVALQVTRVRVRGHLRG
jgi:hypothetical protein